METIEQPKVDENSAQFDSTEGSIGKFKDATRLLEAYNNLQAEFTRKSQELSELKKQNLQADELSKKENALPNQIDSGASENNSREENFVKNNDFDAKMSQNLLNFAENHPEALEQIEPIKQEILANKNLLEIQDGIEIAYRLAKEKQKYSPAELISNPQFVDDYVLSNDEIRTRVIDCYIKSLANKQQSPKLISGESNFSATVSSGEISSLADANKIFRKMLEK